MNFETVARHLPRSLRAALINGKQWVIYYLLTRNFVFSYPRAGVTWTKFFLMQYQALLYNTAPTLNFGRSFKKVHKDAPRTSLGCVGFLKYGKRHMSELAKLSATDVGPFMDAVLQKHKGKRVVVFVRDPRDVVTSLYVHLGAEEDNISLSTFIRDEHTGIEKLVSYMNSFARQKESFASFYISRYEDKRSDEKKYLSELLEVLGYPVKEDLLSEALSKSSFENMKRIQESDSPEEGERFITKATRKSNGPRVREGKTGGYKQMLSKEDQEFVDGVIQKLDSMYNYS